MAPDPPKTIEFMPSGRGKAQCPSDPRYPKGIALDCSMGAGAPYCTVTLPYPAPECGVYIIICDHCTMKVVVTAAGRPDDPTSIKIPCYSQEKKYA